MMWKREIGLEHIKSFDYMLTALVAFFFIGIIFQNAISFIGVGVFGAYLIIFKIYDTSLEKKVKLRNQQTTIKLFPGEESKVIFNMQNQSIFPIVNGEFRFQTGPAIKAYELVEETDDYWNQIEIPLSLLRKRNIAIEIPVIAEQRGVSKINNITFVFPHLFNFDLITLKYLSVFHTEFIVFPKVLPVHGIETVFYMMPGSGRSNFSPFEDILSPLGTRDYSYSDPFHRINWNASVKSQTLQTNVYEKVIDMSYVFIVNLGVKKDLNMVRFNENLENLLSYTAYLCEYATKNGLPYEVYINARKPGKVPYIHLQEGEGRTHYGHALEMLARIQRQSMIMPFNQMLHRLGKQFYKPKTIVFIGEVPSGATQIIDRWKLTQHEIFQVIQAEDGAFVKPIVKEAVVDAK